MSIIPGNQGPSGTDPVQAPVVVSHTLDDLLTDRKTTEGPVLGTAVYAESVELYLGEIAVIDCSVSQQGCMPPTFTSLTGIDVDRSRGQEAFNRRFRFAGTVVTERDFRAASGLYDANVTLQIHGLSPLRWRSPDDYNPVPGDWILMYAPFIDDAKRAAQLDRVMNNSSGARYPQEIAVGHRIPFLTKRFGIEDILLLPQAAVSLFAENPERYANALIDDRWDRSVPLSPELEVLLNILAVPVRLFLEMMKDRKDKLETKMVIGIFMFMNATFAVSPRAQELLRTVKSEIRDAGVEPFMKMSPVVGEMLRYQFATFFQIMQHAQMNIIGKVARPRLSDFISILM